MRLHGKICSEMYITVFIRYLDFNEIDCDQISSPRMKLTQMIKQITN